MDSRLIVILSPERSGSTLLSQMLGGHENIIAPPEMHLLSHKTYSEWREDYPIAINSLLWLLQQLGMDMSEEAADDKFQGWESLRVYCWLFENTPADIRIVDKTPAYARSDEILARIEELRPLYIWLIRHPLGFAASRIEAGYRRRSDIRVEKGNLRADVKYALTSTREILYKYLGVRVRQNLRYWSDINRRIDKLLSDMDSRRYVTIHYEKLVRQPEELLTGICDTAGVRFTAAMLTPWETVPDTLQWGLGDENVRKTGAISTASIDKWRSKYDDSMIDSRTREVMKMIDVET
jgi:Sulfotransferase family